MHVLVFLVVLEWHKQNKKSTNGTGPRMALVWLVAIMLCGRQICMR